MKRAVKRLLPVSLYRPLAAQVRKFRRASILDVRPLRPEFGLGYGTPIDRYYINDFLQKYRGDIKGRVLELGEPGYTKSLGGEQVTHSDVLHAVPGNPMATIVADLTDAPQLSSDAYDCVILTQTLNVIYDVRAVLATVYRILKPDGVVLITVPGISQVSRTDCEQWGDYWRFTSMSARRLVAECFGSDNVAVHVYGNVLAATAFLYGLIYEEMRQEEMDFCDPDYEVVIGVRAVKSSRRHSFGADQQRL